MTLEFEKLTAELEKMAQTAVRRQQRRDELVAEFRRTLREHNSNWAAIGDALAQAARKADEKFYRAARPLDEIEPLNTAVDPPLPPPQATIIAADGSQIMPDRHAAYLYYVVNVGGIVYHHGSAAAPEVFSNPEIFYPKDEESIDDFPLSGGAVSIERDLAEIGALAKVTAAQRHTAARPIVSLVDQRLLYWPIGGAGVADNAAVTEWTGHMTAVRRAGGLLAGYIDRPGTGYVLTLLRALTARADPEFDWRTLGRRSANGGLVDSDLFRELLRPGQRSKVFVNVSPPNDTFVQQDPANEVCFFYLNPGVSGDNIARVDIPRWVAEDAESVTAVHALLVDQCRLMGDYPYVLARADEMAVVGRQDAGELNFMIDVIMERHGVSAGITAKQGSKEVARSGRSRHEGF